MRRGVRLVEQMKVKRRPVAITYCEEGPPAGYESANVVACAIVREAESGRRVYVDRTHHDCWVGQYHLGLLPDADKLIIDRNTARQHASFGFGIHRCLGMRLAEMQMRVLWQEILKRWQRIEITGEVAGLPLESAQLAVNGTPVAIQPDKTWSTTLPLDASIVFNPVLAELVNTENNRKDVERLVVIAGEAVTDGFFSPESIALRLNDSGLDSVEPVVSVSLSRIRSPGTESFPAMVTCRTTGFSSTS